jgi:hypothetical protein
LGFPVFPLEWKTEEGISSGYRERILPWSRCKLWPYWVGMTDGQRVVYFGRISGSFWPKQSTKQEQNLTQKTNSITNIWSNKKTKIYAYLRSYRCFKGITVPENVLIKIVSNQRKSSFCIWILGIKWFLLCSSLSTMLKRLKTGKRKHQH